MPHRFLLEVSPVDTELADAVSNFLWEIGASGVELRDKSATDVSVRGYFDTDEIEGESALAKLREYVASLLELGLMGSLPEISASGLEQRDWTETCRRFFRPLKVSERITVLPPWERPESLRDDEVAVVINPGVAFGTGRHETTRLSLRLLESVISPGSRVLDVGTGSGVLSIAAAKLGAAYALGVDVDELAVKNAMENVELNGVSDRVEVRLVRGELDLDGRFDIVIANIDFDTVTSLLGKLLRACRGEGHLIFSGILAAEGELFSKKLESKGANILRVEREGEWLGFLARR